MIEVSLVARCRLEHTLIEAQLPDITLGRLHSTSSFLARRLVVSPENIQRKCVVLGWRRKQGNSVFWTIAGTVITVCSPSTNLLHTEVCPDTWCGYLTRIPAKRDALADIPSAMYGAIIDILTAPLSTFMINSQCLRVSARELPHRWSNSFAQLNKIMWTIHTQ